jgi:DNA-binding transcriptional LysR family regulator
VTPEPDHPYRHPWLGVEVRHLATLMAVARTRSFRRAAAELGYVRSAVSQQISGLESVIGVRLVERRQGQRTVTLTEAGELLLERSIAIVGQLGAARVDVAATDQARLRTVRLAVASDVAALLTPVLVRVMDELPGVRLRVVEIADDDDLIARLERGGADLGIGAPAADCGLSTATLLHDPFVVLVAPGSPLAGLLAVSRPDQLAGERLIVPASAGSHATLRAAGLRVEHALQVPLAAAIPPLVADGAGVGLVPRSDAAEAGARLVALSTTGLIAPRRIALCWHAARRRSALLQSFSAAVLDAFEEPVVRDRKAALAPAA